MAREDHPGTASLSRAGREPLRLPVSPNVLNRQFNPSGPNQAWVSDITYIRTRSGWLYLAIVLDLYARKVVGWAMAPEMPASLACSVLQLAIAQRQPAPGLIVHLIVAASTPVPRTRLYWPSTNWWAA